MVDSAELTSVMEEIVPYLEAKNNAMKETLEVVLSHTTTAVMRNAFRNTQVIPLLLDLSLNEQETTISEKTLTSCFSCLINFTIDPPFIEKCVNEKAGTRVFQFLMNRVKPTDGALEVHGAELVKVEDAAESGESKLSEQEAKRHTLKQVYEIRDGHANFIQAAVMFLCNLSHAESG